MKKFGLLLILFLLAGIPFLANEATETSTDTSSSEQVEALDPSEITQPTGAPEQTEKSLIVPPKWTDFCESGYENAVYRDSHDVFNIISFVKSERLKKNYWAERRVSFENYLKTCNALDDEAKVTCYQELTKSENQKNDLYKIKRDQLLYEDNIEIHRRYR